MVRPYWKLLILCKAILFFQICGIVSCVEQIQFESERPFENSLGKVYLKMGHNNFSELMKSVFINRWFSVIINLDSMELNGTIRIQGKLSRHYPKKTFKVKVFKGYPEEIKEVFQLSAQYSDDSFCRYRLAQEFFRRAGLLCSEVEPIHLYFDNQYNGLYLKIESVDELFFKKRNLPVSGLYKVKRFASISSKYGVPPQGAFDKKLPNNNDMSYTDLERLFIILDKGITVNDTAELSGIFDIENALNYCAVADLIGHGDGIKSNYYLYYNSRINKFQFIPWDLDLTFKNYPSLGKNYSNNLFEQLLRIETYNTFMKKRMKEIFNYNELVNALEIFAEEIHGAVLNDPWLSVKSNNFDSQIKFLHSYLVQLQSIISTIHN
ncbi:MAG: CotH kinase family protein [Chitinispirillia bacterium]|jgi:spore coat protein H